MYRKNDIFIFLIDDNNKNNKVLHGEFEIFIFDETPLEMGQSITGLLPCTKYRIQIEGHYDVDEDRTIGLSLTTKCSKSDRKNSYLVVSVKELVIIVISCLLVVSTFIFVICCLVQRSRRRRMRRDHFLRKSASNDIIDPRDFGL